MQIWVGVYLASLCFFKFVLYEADRGNIGILLGKKIALVTSPQGLHTEFTLNITQLLK